MVASKTRGLRAVLATIATIAALWSFAFPAVAQELAPEHLALARQYVDLTDTAGVYEVSLVQTGIETMRTLLSQNPGLKEPVNTAIGKVLEGYRANKNDLLDQFARVYALRFTIEELRQIVDFYSSDTGKKLAVVNTDVSSDLQRVLAIFEANLKPEFFARVRAELKAAGVNP